MPTRNSVSTHGIRIRQRLADENALVSRSKHYEAGPEIDGLLGVDKRMLTSVSHSLQLQPFVFLSFYNDVSLDLLANLFLRTSRISKILMQHMYLAYRRCRMCPRRRPIVQGTYQIPLNSSIQYQGPLTISILQCRKKFLQTRPLNTESQQPPSGSAFTCLPMQSRKQ